MSLSKIYRGAETDGLKAYRFASFGDSAPQSAGAAEFIADAEAVPAAAQAAGGHSPQQLEETYAKGVRDGQEQAEQQFGASAKALAAAAAELSRVRENLARNSSQDMLRLVMVIAEQVIRREAKADPEVVFNIIENALQASVRADSYRIRVNPTDLEGVIAKKPLFLASISGLKNLTIEPDPGVSAGGCQVESELGEVDATLETQLAAIRQALDEVLAG
jgi:flagellar assembly protein FliH